MTSATLSKWVILKGGVKRLKWLGIIYLAVLILEIPLPLWMVLARQKTLQGAGWVATKSLQNMQLFHPIAHLTNLAMAVVIGMILFHYLQNERENTFFHSLPVKRTMLYWQNLLAGLTFLWVPLLITAILIMMVLTGLGITQVEWLSTSIYGPTYTIATSATLTPVWQIVGFWIFYNFLMTGLFLVVTIGAGMLTGSAILQGALTLIGLFLPLGLYLLAKYNLWRLLYGFPRANEINIEWYSPLVSYFTENNFRMLFANMDWYAIYMAAVVVLIGLTVYLYKHRKAEAAGETLAADWIRWVFKYGVAVCSALFGGLYFSTLNDSSPGALYLGYTVGALMGYIVADMIAHKSFHFYRRWKGLLIFSAIFAILVVGVKSDLIGYQKYVPEQTAIQQVILSNLVQDNGGPQQETEDSAKGIVDKENINLIRRLHQEIINRQQENVALQKTMSQPQQTMEGKPAPDYTNVMPVTITYILNGGSKVTRNYTIDLKKYREFLYPIFSSQEVKRNLYSQVLQLDSSKLDEINLNNFRVGRNVRIYKPVEIKEAVEAIKKDTLNISYEAAMEGKLPPLASIDFVPKMVSSRGYQSFNLSYYREFTNLQAFLEKHGYLDELFLNPRDVDRIEVSKLNSEVKKAIKDKEQIQQLLDWCSQNDERSFKAQVGAIEAKGMPQYYGKIYKQDGSSIFVTFDGSPANLRVLEKVIK